MTQTPGTEEKTAKNGHDVEWLEAQDETALRQLILQAQDRREELVPVPLWRVKVLVRAMSGTQRTLYEALPRDQKTGRFLNLKHVYFEVLRMSCVHPMTHKPTFQVADEGEVMDEKNGEIIDMLVAKALRLSGLLPSQREEVRKNSETTPTSTTTTGSRNDSDTRE